MSILNQKEQVVDIQLTKYGRKLLGLGIFQPKYYYFYDDSTIYDYSYFNEIETTNSIVPRILNESLTFNNINTSDHLLNNSMGNCKLINDFCPAWDLKILNGNIFYRNEESTFYKKVFDVKDIIYTISMQEGNADIKIEDDYVLIDLQEINLDDDMKNFEIEIIAFDELNGGKSHGVERKLQFIPRKSNIIDDIIYDDEELPSNFFQLKIDENFVSYYLDILVDDEIDTKYIIAPQQIPQTSIDAIYSSKYIGPVDPKC